MAKSCIREFKLADSDGLHPCLNAGGAFVGDGTALLTKDNFGDFVPLPRRELETVLSAGYKFAVDLGSRMQGLTALAKALNQGDYSLASIALAQLQFPALPDKSAGARMSKAAAMLKKGATALEVLKLFLPKGELAKFNPHHLGPGAGGGEFTTAETDGASSGDTKSQGYVTQLSAEEILKLAAENSKTPGWLQPKDVNPRNVKQCVSLVRAVIPELPHSSQWKEGDPITPENSGTIPPGTAIATFTDGSYDNAQHGNHAAIFLHSASEKGLLGILVLDQFEGRHGDKGEVKERFYSFEPSHDSHYLAGAFSVIQ